MRRLRRAVRGEVIDTSLPPARRTRDCRILVNPAGRLHQRARRRRSRPRRKIVVDTYGGACPHGGGAFSSLGYRPRSDRSAAPTWRRTSPNAWWPPASCRRCRAMAYAIGELRSRCRWRSTSGAPGAAERRRSTRGGSCSTSRQPASRMRLDLDAARCSPSRPPGTGTRAAGVHLGATLATELKTPAGWWWRIDSVPMLVSRSEESHERSASRLDLGTVTSWRWASSTCSRVKGRRAAPCWCA